MFTLQRCLPLLVQFYGCFEIWIALTIITCSQYFETIEAMRRTSHLAESVALGSLVEVKMIDVTQVALSTNSFNCEALADFHWTIKLQSLTRNEYDLIFNNDKESEIVKTQSLSNRQTNIEAIAMSSSCSDLVLRDRRVNCPAQINRLHSGQKHIRE